MSTHAHLSHFFLVMNQAYSITAAETCGGTQATKVQAKGQAFYMDFRGIFALTEPVYLLFFVYQGFVLFENVHTSVGVAKKQVQGVELHKRWLVLKLMLSTGIIVDCVGNVVGIYNF